MATQTLFTPTLPLLTAGSRRNDRYEHYVAWCLSIGVHAMPAKEWLRKDYDLFPGDSEVN